MVHTRGLLPCSTTANKTRRTRSVTSCAEHYVGKSLYVFCVYEVLIAPLKSESEREKPQNSKLESNVTSEPSLILNQSYGAIRLERATNEETSCQDDNTSGDRDSRVS